MNILAVGAHPDDIELGCYGAIAKHYNSGDKIFGAIIEGIKLRRKSAQEIVSKADLIKLIDMSNSEQKKWIINRAKDII